VRGAEVSGSSALRLAARATRRGISRSYGHNAQEVVDRQLPQALRYHLQKKSFNASERDEEQRAGYRDELDDQTTQTLVFIDETSAYVDQRREYGWAASTERVYDTRPKGKKTRISLIAAASLDGLMAERALVITNTVNKNAFLAFLETTLLPTLPKGSVIVMDNWSAKHHEGTVHYGDDVRELIERFGCEPLYLPTYSPDLNPIEHLFAKIKAFVKRLRPDSTDKLVQAFCDAVKTVTSENILKSFRHCGYQVEQ
jgi:transposase